MSTGNVAQIREENLFDFCLFFLLTKPVGYVIMEVGTPYTRGRAAEKMGSAVSQAHCPPAEDTDLIVRSTDFHCFTLGAHSETMVDVVDAIF